MTDEATPVAVRAFVRHEGAVLCCQSDQAWDGLVIGPFASQPDPAAVRRNVGSTIGVDQSELTVVRTAGPFETSTELQGIDPPSVFVALIDTEERSIDGPPMTNAKWAPASALLDQESAPTAWDHYLRVSPTVRSITADDEHGAATLSIRALELLRDRATVLVDEGDPDTAELVDLASRIRRARPSMAVLRNRLARAIASGETPAELRSAAVAEIERGTTADRETAFRAAGVIEGATLLMHSRSSTLLDALGTGAPSQVYVSESVPGREGIATAEDLAEDVAVTVHADAAAAHVLATEPIDLVLVGADTVLPDGRIINKTGTRGIALAANAEGIPVYAAAATDKVAHDATVNIETGDAGVIYDGDAPVDVLNPTFDVTPADAVDGIITERGTLATDEVHTVADELASVVAAAGI